MYDGIWWSPRRKQHFNNMDVPLIRTILIRNKTSGLMRLDCIDHYMNKNWNADGNFHFFCILFFDFHFFKKSVDWSTLQVQGQRSALDCYYLERIFHTWFGRTSQTSNIKIYKCWLFSVFMESTWKFTKSFNNLWSINQNI